MDKQQLRAQLEQLRSELQQVESLDQNGREILEKLAGDIQQILERQDTRTQQYGSLRERLKEAVAELEASHPRATILMRQLIDQLSFMGI